MQRMLFKVMALSLGIALTIMAQTAPKKPAAAKKGNIQGTVRLISKDKSEISVRTTQMGERIVVYSADTKWGVGSSKKQTPGSVDNLKEGYFLNCAGTFQDTKLAATTCYFREQK